MAIRLLAIGDIHLGRRLRRLPEALECALSARALGPAGAWQRAVDFALEQAVDAVLLAGDVVDREDDFFEAYGLLEQGVRRLTEAAIPVLAVAGNHDVQVLPRLARTIPECKLLGADGSWEACRVRARGGRGRDLEAVRIVGWSFPTARVTGNPLRHASAGAVLQGAAHPEPTLGLLHCDRDRAQSEHAPVTSRDLAQAAVDGWLLGHIHTPDRLAGPRPIGYLGSLVGLDPSETGARGPWLVEVAHAGRLHARHVALAPLRWERVDVACDAPSAPSNGPALEDAPPGPWVESALLGALRRVREQVGPGPRALGCRVRIVGRTAHGERLRRYLESADPGALCYERDGTWCFVDRVDLHTEPAISLEALARGKDPVGLLAAKLLVLERPAHDPERRRLVEAARARVEEVQRHAPYRALPESAAVADEGRIVALLRAAARRGLEALLAQAAPAGPAPGHGP